MKFLKDLSRIQILGIFLTLFAGLIVFQMISIQTSAHAKNLDQWAKNYGYQVTTIQSERGYIYDRWGNLLAGNKEVYELGVELQFVANPASIASALASIVGSDYNTVFSEASQTYVEGKSVYVTLADFVDSNKIAQIDKLKADYEKNNLYGADPNLPSLRGLVWTAHLQRIYPENDLASNVIGFYSYLDRESGRGFYGVEEKYNDLLAGIKKQVLIPLDPYDLQTIPTAPAGASLVLTIDREIQHATETILEKAVKSTGADNGTIIVMNPRNGEILAMASTPRMNLNEYWNYSKIYTSGVPFNKAISQVYEPGSVFKILTMAAALDTNTVTPETGFTDTGIITVGGWDIYNWDRGAWGPQTMVGCLQHSLNVCLSWVATQVGSTNFYQYLDNFGIGHRTNIDLAGEEVYPLSEPGDPMWYEVNLATNSFGQGVAVTPIQMMMAASSIANDGKMVAPHILKAYIQDGKQYNTNTQIIGMPITATTAHTLTNMLFTSLQQESSDALVEGYSVAGKTGTAEIAINGQYSSNQTNASFIGWGPTDDPQFMVYVWLEKPSSSIWGSVVAAPVFSDEVKQLVVLMNIPPDSVRLSLQGQ
ncbi:MAG: peptidoglycan D,D-transpeptidase FtsI family protein [Anaerolineaceae bacterium]